MNLSARAHQKHTATGLLAILIVVVMLSTGDSLRAQDTRTVTEPSFPATCTILPAKLGIKGGEPTSETAFDTDRIQSALNNCAPGKAVELAESPGHHAFLIAPITLPSQVTLIVDAGVTVFASRNPADYQTSGNVEKCGTVGTKGNGCNHLIVRGSGENRHSSGIMGYGIIDGRGGDKLLINGKPGPYSWWEIGERAYLTTPYGRQNNPVMIWMQRVSDFKLYKITIKNGPMFHFLWVGPADGLTVWDAKIIAPYTAPNTDGIDPGNAISNITIKNSYISNGDDQIAINANGDGNSASHISITNLHTYSGRGVSIGSSTSGGISDVLVDHLNQSGNADDVHGNGFRIKTAADRGGMIKNITYQNVCQRNEMYPIRFDPFYIPTSSRAAIPTFQNITVRNVTVLDDSKAFTSRLVLQGYDASHATTLTLDNVNISNSPDFNPAPRDVHFTLGSGPVNPRALQELSGTGVTYNGSVDNAKQAPYACSSSNFVPLVGELFLSASGTTNRRSLSLNHPSTFTLNAVLEATSAEYSTPRAGIEFYEGKNLVGTAKFTGNGTLASLTLTGVSTGTHHYTATYPGDNHYSAYSFGSVTVTLN